MSIPATTAVIPGATNMPTFVVRLAIGVRSHGEIAIHPIGMIVTSREDPTGGMIDHDWLSTALDVEPAAIDSIERVETRRIAADGPIVIWNEETRRLVPDQREIDRTGRLPGGQQRAGERQPLRGLT